MFGFGKKARAAKAEIKKFEKRDLMEAAVGGCLLVAFADGSCEETELRSMDALLRTNPALDGFGHELTDTINRYTERLKAGYPANPKIANIWLRRMVDVCFAAQSRFPVPVIDLCNDMRRELVAAGWARRCQQMLASAGNESTAAELMTDLGAQAKA